MPKQQLPSPSGGMETKPRTTSLPEPEGGSFNDFFKPKHLGKNGSGSVLVLGVRDAPQNSFSDVVIEVRMGKVTFDWGMKFSSGNYRRLHERFGSNPSKWKGKVNVGIKEYAGKKYVAVLD